MTRFAVLIPLVILLLSAVACANNNPAEATPEQATPSATPTSALTPTPTAEPTSTPEPTRIPATIEAGRQILAEDGVLTFDLVTLPENGWLVVYRAVDGEPDQIIGQLSLAADVHEAVEVAVDVEQATEEMFAALLADEGTAGMLDADGADEPFAGTELIPLTVDIQLPRPQVAISEQTVDETGLVLVDVVEAVAPSWLTIHADEGGTAGAILGSAYLEPGPYEDLAIALDWRLATPIMYAVLHEDTGEPRLLEYPEDDLPVLLDGEPVMAEFTATLPPDILVYDQPVVDSRIVVDRVISNGPGWLAVTSVTDGVAGPIIGHAGLEDGLNEQVIVELIEAAVTPQLLAQLHHDTEPGGAFDFPAEDPPVLRNGRLPNPTPFRTDVGAYLIVHDQPLGADGSLTVQLVVVPTDAWLVVFDDEEGEPGSIVATAAVPPGLSHDVNVLPEGSLPPGRYYAALHQDTDAAGEFDYPDGDVPIVAPGSGPVFAPFDVLESALQD